MLLEPSRQVLLGVYNGLWITESDDEGRHHGDEGCSVGLAFPVAIWPVKVSNVMEVMTQTGGIGGVWRGKDVGQKASTDNPTDEGQLVQWLGAIEGGLDILIGCEDVCRDVSAISVINTPFNREGNFMKDSVIRGEPNIKGRPVSARICSLNFLRSMICTSTSGGSLRE